MAARHAPAALRRDPEVEDVLRDLEARLAAIAHIHTRDHDESSPSSKRWPLRMRWRSCMRFGALTCCFFVERGEQCVGKRGGEH